MTITRIDPEDRWSEAVIHNNVIYYTSVPTDLRDDAYTQTQSALAEIDKAWDEWVVKGKAPVRCTVQAGLMKKEYLIEIKIVAAVNS